MRDIPVSEASATVHSVSVRGIHWYMIINYTTRDQIKICNALASNIIHGESEENRRQSAVENAGIRVAITRSWLSRHESPGKIRTAALRIVVEAIAVISVTVSKGLTWGDRRSPIQPTPSFLLAGAATSRRTCRVTLSLEKAMRSTVSEDASIWKIELFQSTHRR